MLFTLGSESNGQAYISVDRAALYRLGAGDIWHENNHNVKMESDDPAALVAALKAAGHRARRFGKKIVRLYCPTNLKAAHDELSESWQEQARANPCHNYLKHWVINQPTYRAIVDAQGTH